MFVILFFFFYDTPTTVIYTYGHTISLHDALPISSSPIRMRAMRWSIRCWRSQSRARSPRWALSATSVITPIDPGEVRQQKGGRSEEHTSELQSLMRKSYAVFCLQKKKQTEVNRDKIKTIVNKDIENEKNNT